MSPANAGIWELFSEEAYLASYPDVAAAVSSGAIASGRLHFELFGSREGRAPNPAEQRDRKTCLLEGLAIGSLQGVEIGALARPLVTPAEGRIFYIDHVDTETLKQKYAGMVDVDPDQIVDVDAVWGDLRLKDCVPDQFTADYVVASHVVEHVPDLLGWFTEIAAILSEAGEIRLAVPDRRYTFDYLRHESRSSEVLDAYLQQARRPSALAIIDFKLGVRAVKTEDAWLKTLTADDLPPIHTVQEAMTGARRGLRGEYIDVHCWVFTPRSFAQIMEDAATAGLLDFECAMFNDTALLSFEFFVGLAKTTDRERAARSWRRMRETARG